MTHVTIIYGTTTETERPTFFPEATAATGAASRGRRRRVPLTMPSDQTYYWSQAWQEQECEALEDLDAGRFARFDSEDPTDAVRWLNEPDDED
jgi:hypothetical protein